MSRPMAEELPTYSYHGSDPAKIRHVRIQAGFIESSRLSQRHRVLYERRVVIRRLEKLTPSTKRHKPSIIGFPKS